MQRCCYGEADRNVHDTDGGCSRAEAGVYRETREGSRESGCVRGDTGCRVVERPDRLLWGV